MSASRKLSAESLEAFAAGDKIQIRQVVHQYICTCGPSGATADQASLALGLLTNSVAPRLNELKKAELVVRLEVRRKTRSGCFAAVYVAAEFKPAVTLFDMTGGHRDLG
jgi:hypothetical protein